jgi:hypothetical protein
MHENSDLNEQVCVTFTVGDWAKIVASIASSGLPLMSKDALNSNIYECVTRTERALS